MAKKKEYFGEDVAPEKKAKRKVVMRRKRKSSGLKREQMISVEIPASFAFQIGVLVGNLAQ